jgi:hypothetical protein
MAKITWGVSNETDSADYTSLIMSMSIRQGREKYLDTYSGGSCVFTIKNYNNYAASINYGDRIVVYSTPPGVNSFALYFWVQEVTYNDYQGNTGLPTATISCVDFMGRAGRVNAEALVLAQADTLNQAEKFNASQGGPLPSDMVVGGYGPNSGSIASATTYTGSVNNFINLLVTTERGYLIERGLLYFISRTDAASLVPIATTIGRTTSSTQIAYQEFERIQNGTQFINTATISPNGLASQTATNTASKTTYGPAFYSSSTQDYNTTQGLGNANWVVNNFSDPASLRFGCSFSDVMQNTTALTSWIGQFWGLSAARCINLQYQVPGGSLTTTTVIMEGVDIDVTPDQTNFKMSFSPLQYYQFFTLNSTSLGVLDTSRLGW